MLTSGCIYDRSSHPNGNNYPFVDPLHVFHDLTQPANKMSRINLAQRSMIFAEILCLSYQLLPTRIA